jgi:hypothetical protein
MQLSVSSQETVLQENYYNIVIGNYETKSSIEEFIFASYPIIKPQIKFYPNTSFLKIEQKGIALFNSINDLAKIKPIGILQESSVIQIDTIFYKEIYKDTTKEWSLSFNVWYAITINGKQYYTDHKIHDFVAFKMNLDKFNQEFLVVSQSTGYDEYYDKGYPNQFFIAILNDNKEMIYDSEILNFDYGEEFWDNERMSSLETEFTENGLEFTLIGVDSIYKGIWSGKELRLNQD